MDRHSCWGYVQIYPWVKSIVWFRPTACYWNILFYNQSHNQSPVAQCVARRAPMQQCVWWLVLAPSSAALRLLGSLRISHNKFLGPINKSLSLNPHPYLHWGEFNISAFCCSYRQSLQSSFLVPLGTHHCWVGRGSLEYISPVVGIEPQTFWSWVQRPIHWVTWSQTSQADHLKNFCVSLAII